MRWSPWYRRVPLRLASDLWPRMTEGPVSAAARLAWVVPALVVIVGWLVEAALVVVLAPPVWLGRATGLLSWHVDVREHGCRAGAIRVSTLRAARRLRRVVPEHLCHDRTLSGSRQRAVLAAEHAAFTPLAIRPGTWRRRVRRRSPYARRRWFLWRRRTSLRFALEFLPSDGGDELISLALVLPLLLFSTVLGVAALGELLVQSLILPVVVVLKLGHVMPWPIETVRDGESEPHARVVGFAASVRTRRELDAQLRIAPTSPSVPEERLTAA